MGRNVDKWGVEGMIDIRRSKFEGISEFEIRAVLMFFIVFEFRVVGLPAHGVKTCLPLGLAESSWRVNTPALNLAHESS